MPTAGGIMLIWGGTPVAEWHSDAAPQPATHPHRGPAVAPWRDPESQAMLVLPLGAVVGTPSPEKS